MPSPLIGEELQKSRILILNAAFYKTLSDAWLFRFFAALTLVDQHQHKHLTCEPECRADWNCGEACLNLCNSWIR